MISGRSCAIQNTVSHYSPVIIAPFVDKFIAPASRKNGLFAAVHESGFGRYCCKSPKLPGANFLAVKKSDRRTPIDVASITLPRSPSLSSGNEVPHIFTRKSRVQPKEILITSEKDFCNKNGSIRPVRTALGSKSVKVLRGSKPASLAYLILGELYCEASPYSLLDQG